MRCSRNGEARKELTGLGGKAGNRGGANEADAGQVCREVCGA